MDVWNAQCVRPATSYADGGDRPREAGGERPSSRDSLPGWAPTNEERHVTATPLSSRSSPAAPGRGIWAILHNNNNSHRLWLLLLCIVSDRQTSAPVKGRLLETTVMIRKDHTLQCCSAGRAFHSSYHFTSQRPRRAAHSRCIPLETRNKSGLRWCWDSNPGHLSSHLPRKIFKRNSS